MAAQNPHAAKKVNCFHKLLQEKFGSWASHDAAGHSLSFSFTKPVNRKKKEDVGVNALKLIHQELLLFR